MPFLENQQYHKDEKNKCRMEHILHLFFIFPISNFLILSNYNLFSEDKSKHKRLERLAYDLCRVRSGLGKYTIILTPKKMALSKVMLKRNLK